MIVDIDNFVKINNHQVKLRIINYFHYHYHQYAYYERNGNTNANDDSD